LARRALNDYYAIRSAPGQQLMNYRHAFHAGNFADVHKHVVLLAVLQRLQRKPAPIAFLDTHAGRGEYLLNEAAASQEWRAGIGQLFGVTPRTSELRHYLEVVRAMNPQQHLTHYPGSPLLVRHCLRPDDRMTCIEQQPAEARALREVLDLRRAQVICGDGYIALQRQLPPKENRGLVLIDPPYEDEQEFSRLVQALPPALEHWRNGVFACWYPLKADARVERFHAALTHSGLRKLLLLELAVQPMDSPLGLNGSGMLLINPPWQLDTELLAALQELHQLLAPQGAGGVRVRWLVPE
jgi:23S rRNA (adenine2030-N6)-methyltransferase